MELVALLEVTDVQKTEKYDVVHGRLADAPDEEGVEELKLSSNTQLSFVVNQKELLGKTGKGDQWRVTFELHQDNATRVAAIKAKQQADKDAAEAKLAKM